MKKKNDIASGAEPQRRKDGKMKDGNQNLRLKVRATHRVALQPIVRYILCKLLGLHQWRLFPQAGSYYLAFPHDSKMVSRRCLRCFKMQCTDDGGKTWSNRM